jgi:hypothetical protein
MAMDIKANELELSKRERIVVYVTYLLRYFEFFSDLYAKLPEKHPYTFLISYMKFVYGVVLVLNLSTLFNEKEKHSFASIYKWFGSDYMMNDNLKSTIQKLRHLRDKYYAHIDSFDCNGIVGLDLIELKELVTEAKLTLGKIKSQYFTSSDVHDLTDDELGITFLKKNFNIGYWGIT